MDVHLSKNGIFIGIDPYPHVPHVFPTFKPLSPAPRRSARDRPGFASRLMLQSAMGLSALPLKTVRAVGATKDLGLRKNRRMPEIFVEKKPGFFCEN